MLPAILFDLDGTLIDSIELILSSARHAFTGFAGRAPSDDD
jgi:phosphoglycolate phosphatase-like HAD superfamily hydrolase